MHGLKQTAVEVFGITEFAPVHCKGGHEICIRCRRCFRDDGDRIYNPKEPLAEYIDHTLLKPDAVQKDILALCAEAQRYRFRTVCVNPVWVSLARETLNGVGVCAVVGFPLGATGTETKVQETRQALQDGACEIDMVINQGWLKSRKLDQVQNDIAAVADETHRRSGLLKVIIETCNLTGDEKILACLLAKKGGADYVKTSTGFGSGGATVEDIRLMRKIVGVKAGVKASGGIRDQQTALAMLQAGASRIGASKSVQIVEGA